MPKSKFFTCKNCHKKVFFEAPGTKNRNHCPYCLYSLHVDNHSGDRESACGGLMEPIGKIFKLDEEEVLVHECLECGKIRKNRVAGDDSYELVKELRTLEYF